ncbi:MAG: beta-ketoacyl-ACP reductase [Candidatus Diapherotrites archaeon]|uniref:Beta-ketoacyl-ACP reductase n=1 Tax=Candidatus Iainarchaeum sp. TaxID=3101447 RepID=A0A2D6LPV6_9ARCH|nr:beta-ketoacyl-ACP reductase [Candidatus Diapherotrites archaeon]|tara:strand:+ start:11389 stop:12126 length:738 start_codon:yes stop_codon:yes gene_type:complete
MFKEKTCLVTGASGGIGKSIAIILAKENCNVIINYQNNEEKANQIVEEINNLGRKAIAIKANVSDPKEVEAMFKESLKEFGKIDFLVNNAGITRDNLFLKMEENDWDAVINVNLKGTFNCTKAVLPLMISQGFGKIVNLTSISGQLGNIGQTNYAASKAGVIGFTKSIAKEVALKGINVNAVAPGIINTKLQETIPEKVMQKFLNNIPMKKIGEPKDVAAAVKFLLSDEASYITGEVINVNGGLF